MLQASSAWSQAHADDRPDDVGSFLMETFDDLIPAGLPRAFYATVHRWRYAHGRSAARRRRDSRRANRESRCVETGVKARESKMRI